MQRLQQKNVILVYNHVKIFGKRFIQLERNLHNTSKVLSSSPFSENIVLQAVSYKCSRNQTKYPGKNLWWKTKSVRVLAVGLKNYNNGTLRETLHLENTESFRTTPQSAPLRSCYSCFSILSNTLRDMICNFLVHELFLHRIFKSDYTFLWVFFVIWLFKTSDWNEFKILLSHTTLILEMCETNWNKLFQKRITHTITLYNKRTIKTNVGKGSLSFNLFYFCSSLSHSMKTISFSVLFVSFLHEVLLRRSVQTRLLLKNLDELDIPSYSHKNLFQQEWKELVIF